MTTVTSLSLPFDAARLDELLDDIGADWLLVCTRHNLQYLLGGYRFFFFEHFDPVGLTRYLPLLALRRGNIDQAFYVAHFVEAWQLAVDQPWIAEVIYPERASTISAPVAGAELQRRGPHPPTIAIEAPFMPGEALDALQKAIPSARFVDATRALEQLRAVKTPNELELIRAGSDAVVAAMLETFAEGEDGPTERDLVQRYRTKVTAAGLDFDYALIATGKSFNRAPSSDRWQPGSVLSFDSGARLEGYIGDLCRMAVRGEPTAAMQQGLDEVAGVQDAVRRTMAPGVRGGDLVDAARAALEQCTSPTEMSILIHGLGLVTHECPHLMPDGHSYFQALDVDRGLEPGMVISVETDYRHPDVGLIKLEDTLAVTSAGYQAFGDGGRGWNVCDA